MQTLGLTTFEQVAIYCVLGVSFLGLAYAIFLRNQVLKEDKGTEKMQEVWGWIRDGADAYLKRQLKAIIPLILMLTIAVYFSSAIVPVTPEALHRFDGLPEEQIKFFISIGRAAGFVMGSLFSLIVGQIGMRMAVQANVRVASAAAIQLW